MIEYRKRLPRLPIPVPPYPDETLWSFTSRLRHANHLTVGTIDDLRKETGYDLATVLEQLTGYGHRDLLCALPELRSQSDVDRYPELAGRVIAGSGRGRPACEHCARARTARHSTGIGTAFVWATHEQLVCHRHQRWLGDGTADPGTQLSIRHCSDITRANRRHRNLIVRLGREHVRGIYAAATTIVRKWFRRGDRYTSTSRRLDTLLGDRDSCSFLEPHPHAALYPNAVALTAILASPYWRTLGRSHNPDDRQLLADRVAAEVTNGYRPSVPSDPLMRWLRSPKPDYLPPHPETLQTHPPIVGRTQDITAAATLGRQPGLPAHYT